MNENKNKDLEVGEVANGVVGCTSTIQYSTEYGLGQTVSGTPILDETGRDATDITDDVFNAIIKDLWISKNLPIKLLDASPLDMSNNDPTWYQEREKQFAKFVDMMHNKLN